MASLSRDLAMPILKNCFPGVNNIRIVEEQVQEGQRHLTSDVTRFIVEYEQDHVTQRKYIVMKVPTCGALFSFCEKFRVYDKEINMYEKVMPRINKYLDKRLAPDHLYTTEAKILVLEDLTARGYVSGEKLSLLNLHEAKGAMKTFAHYHSATHKLYEEVPHIFDNLLGAYFDEFNITKIVAPWRSVVLALLRSKNDHRLVPKVEAAFSYIEEHNGKASAILDKSKFKFVALNHGDGRKNNFLFKHTANSEVQVQFVDYQCCFISSPAYDISVFLHSSISPDVLEAHFDELIDEYLHELNIKLEKLDCASTYERADFDEDFKTLKLFFFFSFIILCGSVCSMNRQQLEDLISSSGNNTYLCDACLNDEQFVLPVYGWLQYFEKSEMFNEL